MEVTKVSEESLQKALETLGLVKAAEAAPAAPAAKVEEPAVDTAKQALEAELAETLQKAEEIKNKLNPPAPAAAPVVEAAKPEVSEEIVKGFNDKIQALGTIIQAKTEKEEVLQKAVETVVEQNKKLQEFNEQLAKKIGMLEQQPMERKSVTPGVGAVERFEKAEGATGPVTQVSISDKRQRTKIVDALWEDFEKGEHKDAELAKAVQQAELGFLGNDAASQAKLQARLLKNHNIQVVN